MANIINLSCAGVKLQYAVETIGGTRPTTGYVQLRGLKSTPSLNPSPETIESTTLDETKYKTYIEGLKDIGGALEFTFNLTQNLVDEWDALITAYEAGIAAEKETWFTINIPGLDESVYFKGKPSAMGIPETSVGSILEITNYITPSNEPAFYTKPTE